MRKLTFLMLFALLGMMAEGQELITDGGFESPSSYTVTESTNTVLNRVTAFNPTTTVATNPTATATSVAAGMWVLKTTDFAEPRGLITTTDKYSGSNCLNLRINNNATTTRLDFSSGSTGDAWKNCVLLQKINGGLNNTKRYSLSFWAKKDATAGNTMTTVSVFLCDNTATTQKMMAKAVYLSGGATWTQYTVYFDVAGFKTMTTSADFTTAFAGIGILTTTGTNVTNYGGVLIDDMSLTEFTGTPVTKYVKPTATGASNGSSWTDAAGAAQIQAMVNAVADNADKGEVRFSAGTFTLADAIQLKDGVNLTGGYDVATDTRDLSINQTIFEAAANKKHIFNGDGIAYPVFQRITKVDGIIFQKGTSTYGSSAAISFGMVLENCTFRNCSGGSYGGAIFIKRQEAIMKNHAHWNQAGSLINCLISNNTTSGKAAGVFVNGDAHFSMLNCTLANNKSTDATDGVGGLFVGTSIRYSRIANNIFYNNTSTTSGRTSFYSATTDFQDVFNNYFSDATLPPSNNILAANANKTSTDIPSPGFAAPNAIQGYDAAKMAEIAASDWRLSAGSGLIGLGSTAKAGIPVPYNSTAIWNNTNGRSMASTDIMGSARVINTTIEMGAYEYNPVTVTTAAGTNGTVSATTTVSKGSSVTLTATPNAGCKFSAWTVTSGTAPAPPATSTWTFTPTVNCTVSASFSSLLTTASVTYSRTASSLDILVTKPTYTGTLTYKILDVNNNILAQNVTATTQNATLVYSATGLVKNTTYTYKIVAVLDGVEYAPVTLNATTRKYINNSVEVIDDFEDGVQYWSNINNGTVTNGASNTITNGINSSAKCNKLTVNSGAASYVGMKAAIERVEVGPGAFYQYLHVKMYRDATYSNSAGIAVTFIAREDNSTITQVGTPLATVSGINTWVDYVFDLRSASSTNKTLFSFYIRPAELTSGTHAGGFSCYIDDVYLSNSATPSTGNVTPRITVSATSGGTSANTGTVIKVAGDEITLNATANADNHFVNWTENGTQASVENPYEFTASANRTLVANFEPNTVPVSSGTINASSITCTTCDVTVASGAELTVGATKDLKSVTVAAGGKLTITGGALNVTNGITLESDATGTATLVDAYETPTVNATVKQYVTAGRNWYMSAPLNNTANVSDLNKGNSVQYYDESTGLWEIASGTLTRGIGYIQVANSTQGTSGTVEFAGIVNSGNVEVTLTNNTAGRGFNLVGNPYPSYLNWSLVATDLVNTHPTTGAKMPNGTAWYRTIDYNGKSAWATGVVYAANSVVYNGTSFYKTLTGGTSGATAPTGTGTNISDGSVIWQNEGSVYIFATVSSNGTPSHASVSNLIPPMQAFWVKTNTGGGTLTFKNSMRAHESVSNKLKAPKSQLSTMPFVRLSVSNGASADQVAIYASDNASNDFDSADAPKFFNNSGSYQAEIYTLAGNEKLAINALNSIKEGTALALGFVTEKDNRFSLKATEIANLPANLQLILRDKQTNTEFNLSEGEVYQFGSSATNNADRLSLIFRAKGTTTGFDNKNQSQAIVYTNATGQIVISAPEKINYAIYNAVGQLIENGVLNTERETRNTKHLVAGVYVVKVNNQSTRVVVK